jgi:uncharacterized membrane protein YkvA (DUF1232 family)
MRVVRLRGIAGAAALIYGRRAGETNGGGAVNGHWAQSASRSSPKPAGGPLLPARHLRPGGRATSAGVLAPQLTIHGVERRPSGAASITAMTWGQALVIAAVAAPALYAAFIVAFIVAGRRQDARALADFIPDCIVLFRRLLRDDRVARRSKLLLAGLIGYLALPIDLVPDFIPVAGQLDDAIIVVLALRSVLRAGGPQLLREYWPGPQSSLNAISRLAYGPPQREA